MAQWILRTGSTDAHEVEDGDGPRHQGISMEWDDSRHSTRIFALFCLKREEFLGWK